MQKPAQFVPGRGVNVSGTGLFQNGDGLTMYATKRMAADFAAKWGWPRKYVCRVHVPLWGGYAVAQLLQSTIIFLKDDGTTLEYPYFDKRRQPFAIE